MELLRYFAITSHNSNILYITPTYQLGETLFKNLTKSLESIPVVKSINRSKLSLTFNNESVISFKSAERHENIRGSSIDYVFLDEFSFFKKDAWDSIKPVIAAKIESKVFIASTPKGRNLFFEMCSLGQSDNTRYAYHFMHYTDNPLYDLQEVLDAKNVLPDYIYRTEYEAEFITDSGSVFKNTESVKVITEWQQPVPNKKYFAGLDIGKHDSTVLTILNDKNEVVYIHRETEKSYNLIIDNILKILNLYNPLTYVETNGVGDVFYDMLVTKYSRLVPWQNNNNVKTNMIELLITSINEQSIKLPTQTLYDTLSLELNMFTYNYNTKTRRVHYEATQGFHDDHIISLGLANLCHKENKFIGNFITSKRDNKYRY